MKQRNKYLGKNERENLEKYCYYSNKTSDQDHIAINLGTELKGRMFLLNNRRVGEYNKERRVKVKVEYLSSEEESEGSGKSEQEHKQKRKKHK